MHPDEDENDALLPTRKQGKIPRAPGILLNGKTLHNPI